MSDEQQQGMINSFRYSTGLILPQMPTCPKPVVCRLVVVEEEGHLVHVKGQE